LRILNSIVITLGTFFYIGYMPFAPGTFGSLAGLFIFWLIKGDAFFCILAAAVLTIIGFLVSGRAEKIINRKDPSVIVIDEVSGILISLIFIPYDLKLVVLAFLLFRILDTLKPYPAGKLQNLKGSLGIMIDDIIAGIYTNIILQLVIRLASFKTS